MSKVVIPLQASHDGIYNLVNHLGTSDAILAVFDAQGRLWKNFDYQVTDTHIWIFVGRPDVPADFLHAVVMY